MHVVVVGRWCLNLIVNRCMKCQSLVHDFNKLRGNKYISQGHTDNSSLLTLDFITGSTGKAVRQARASLGSTHFLSAISAQGSRISFAVRMCWLPCWAKTDTARPRTDTGRRNPHIPVILNLRTSECQLNRGSFAKVPSNAIMPTKLPQIRLVTFDALHTIITPRQPIHVQYSAAFEPYLGTLEPEAVKKSFKMGMQIQH